MAPLFAAIVLTKDEAPNLPHCLKSLAGIPAEVYVVDSGSKDETLEIARAMGAHVLSNPWKNYSSQFNWALDNIKSSAPWILRIDADELLSPELRLALVRDLPKLAPDISGILVRLRIYFLGRWMRHGGMYPIWLLRVWRRDTARCEDRWMDEHIILRHGSTVRLRADLIHNNRKSLASWIEKHCRYAVRESADLLSIPSSVNALVGQARVKRWLKERLYCHLPLFLRAWMYWVLRYFLRLGFLDGKEGFAYHFFHALWYRSLVDATLCERKRAGENGDRSTNDEGRFSAQSDIRRPPCTPS